MQTIFQGRVIAEKTRATYWLPPKDAEEVLFDYQPLEEGNDIIIEKRRLKFNQFIHLDIPLAPLLSLSMISISFQVISCLSIQSADLI